MTLSRQPYYRWLAAPIPEAEVAEAYRANALFDAHCDDPEFGYRYLRDEAESAGQPMAVRTAWRPCLTNTWLSVFGKDRAKNGKKPGPPVHDNLCAAGDNAAMESYFAPLQKNVLDRRRRVTHDQSIIAIVTRLEWTYRRRRRQARLGCLTPNEYGAIIEPSW